MEIRILTILIANIWLVEANSSKVSEYNLGIFTSSYLNLNQDQEAVTISWDIYTFNLFLQNNKAPKFYQLTIVWERILPTSVHENFNKDGMESYKRIITKLIEYKFDVMVILLDYRIPDYVLQTTSLTNERFIEFFKIYANILFDYFGKYVKYWVTLSDTDKLCRVPYSRRSYNRWEGEKEYFCFLNLLKAHASVYRLYKEIYNHKKVKVGINIKTSYYFPYGNNIHDAEAVMAYNFGIMAHPIFSEEGDWPPIVLERNYHYFTANTRFSRMDKNLKEFIRGTADFLGLIYEGAMKVVSKPIITLWTFYSGSSNCLALDMRADLLPDLAWEKTSCLPGHERYIVPSGFYELLIYISKYYGNVKIFALEISYCPLLADFHDTRYQFVGKYVKALNLAREHNVSVIGASYANMDIYLTLQNILVKTPKIKE